MLPGSSAAMQQQPWRRRRFWHCPEPHALLRSCVALPDQDCVRTHTLLDRLATAFLQDFQVGGCALPARVACMTMFVLLLSQPPQPPHSPFVCMQVHGQKTTSSFALLEAACATGRAAAADDGAAPALALTGACFGSPQASDGAMQCLLHLRSGAVRLHSMHAAAADSAQHLTCNLAAVQERPTSTPVDGSSVSYTILGIVRRAVLHNLTAETHTTAFYSIAEPGCAQGGFWMHPAAAEAAAAMQTLLHRNPASWQPCRALRPACCGAVLCRGRRAASGKLHASLRSRRRRRGRRSTASLAVQLCSGQPGFEVAALEQAEAVPLVAAEATYTTIWQRVPEPAQTQPSKWVAPLWRQLHAPSNRVPILLNQGPAPGRDATS